MQVCLTNVKSGEMATLHYFNPMAQSKQKSLAPIFIVGSGRSGTTLLRSLLNASGQIHFPYESDFIARAYPFYQDKQDFSTQDYRELVKFFVRTSQKRGWHMTENYLLSSLIERSPQTFSEINSTIYEAYLKQEGLENLQWGIKTPVLIASLDRITSVFPNARIVHIVRDGRDVYLSYQNIHRHSPEQEKFGPKNVLQTAFYWVDGLRRIEAFQGQQIYQLRYEDLLTSPESELRKVLAFMEMEYDPSILEKYSQLSTNQKLILLQSYHEKSIKNKPKNRLDSSNMNKYLKQMPKGQRLIFELIASPYLKKYGYSVEFEFLTSRLLNPLRNLGYFGARLINDLRYHRRELQAYQKTVCNITASEIKINSASRSEVA